MYIYTHVNRYILKNTQRMVASNFLKRRMFCNMQLEFLPVVFLDNKLYSLRAWSIHLFVLWYPLTFKWSYENLLYLRLLAIIWSCSANTAAPEAESMKVSVWRKQNQVICTSWPSIYTLTEDFEVLLYCRHGTLFIV